MTYAEGDWNFADETPVTHVTVQAVWRIGKGEGKDKMDWGVTRACNSPESVIV